MENKYYVLNGTVVSEKEYREWLQGKWNYWKSHHSYQNPSFNESTILRVSKYGISFTVTF